MTSPTDDPPLATRTRLYGILRCSDCANTAPDKVVVLIAAIEDWIEELDGVICPQGDLSLPKTLPKSRTGAQGWRRKAAKRDREIG